MQEQSAETTAASQKAPEFNLREAPVQPAPIFRYLDSTSIMVFVADPGRIREFEALALFEKNAF